MGLRPYAEGYIRYPAGVSVFETILVFAVIPLAIYGVVALLTLRSKFVSPPRYRPGQEWEYPPVWWGANPKGLDSSHSHGAPGTDSQAADAGVRGGARGSW